MYKDEPIGTTVDYSTKALNPEETRQMSCSQRQLPVQTTVPTKLFVIKIRSIYLPPLRTPAHHKGRQPPRVKRWGEVYQGNGPRKQADVTALTTDAADIKPKPMRMSMSFHNHHLKHPCPEQRCLQFHKINVVRCKVTLVTGDFNSPLSPTDNSSLEQQQQKQTNQMTS